MLKPNFWKCIPISAAQTYVKNYSSNYKRLPSPFGSERSSTYLRYVFAIKAFSKYTAPHNHSPEFCLHLLSIWFSNYEQFRNVFLPGAKLHFLVIYQPFLSAFTNYLHDFYLFIPRFVEGLWKVQKAHEWVSTSKYQYSNARHLERSCS